MMSEFSVLDTIRRDLRMSYGDSVVDIRIFRFVFPSQATSSIS